MSKYTALATAVSEGESEGDSEGDSREIVVEYVACATGHRRAGGEWRQESAARVPQRCGEGARRNAAKVAGGGQGGNPISPRARLQR